MGGREYRLRYIGVNAPESSEGLGREASEANAGLVEGQTLYLIKDVSDTDQYGRLLRYVFTGSLFVNYELAAGGWARQGDYPPDTACSQTLSEAEQTAREAKLGLWAASAAGPAAAALQIVTVYYDGQAGQNEPDEYVEIRNGGAQTVNLADWYLKDLGRNRFIFPNLEMTPGQTCRVYTNEDHPESCGLSFGKSGSAVWNNSGDCAALYDPAGYLVDEFCYP
ncbi:MAG: lamin tail domain-containing protein, partial [Anaerolineaceae bacterium]